MENSHTHPYLTASLCASATELDLSGSLPFSLQVIITLHASKPVILYGANTFLSPSVALRQGVIDFVRQGEKPQLEPRNTIHINRGHMTDRPWTPDNFLVLEPHTPTTIDVPLGSQSSPASPETKRFDLRLWMNTATFERGESYTATLPSANKVSWWRWATPYEVQYRVPAQTHSLSAAWSAVCQWMNGEKGNERSVPVLPGEDQLVVHSLGAGVTFTCVGRRVEYSGG